MKNKLEFWIDEEIKMSEALKKDCTRIINFIDAEIQKNYRARNIDKTVKLLECFNMAEEMTIAGQKITVLLYSKKYSETFLIKLKAANSNLRTKLSILAKELVKITDENIENN